MIVKPNCKINLGLNIVRKRIDGYHDIETVFYPVGICDSIEINPSDDGMFHFSSSGLKIPGDPATNLCVQAYNLMKEHFNVPPVTIHLQKNIPMGSGLGGGSSDGAYTLKALNELIKPRLTSEHLKAFASRLGSDCTFFVDNKPAFAKGRGELLSTVSVPLPGLYLLIVIPQVHVNTIEAYSLIQPARPVTSIKETINLPVSQWKGRMINDFEDVVIRKYPLIGQIKELLYENGAVYASMSGSGSAVYGLFNETPAVDGLFPGCFVWMADSR